MKRNKIGIFALMILIVSSLLIYIYQTDCFHNRIKIIDILTSDGNCINAKLYMPKDADVDNKKAAIITTGGGDNEYVMVEMINLELARRGYVVVSFSLYNHGASDIAADDDYGVSEVIKYVQTLGFVDADNIGAVGHSRAAAYILDAVSKEHGIKSILSIEYFPQAFSAYDSETKVNIGLIGNRYNEYVTEPLGFLKSDELKRVFGTENISINTEYGDKEENTLRKAYLINSTDSTYAFSQRVIESAVDYFGLSLSNPKNSAADGYLWKYVETLSLIALVSMFIVMLELADGLVGIIAGKKDTSKEKMVVYTKNEKRQSKRLMYLGIAVGAVSYIPLYMLGKRILSANVIFPQNSTNGQLIWAFFICLTEMSIIIICEKKKILSNMQLGEVALEQTKMIIKYFYIAAISFAFVYITLLVKRSFWGQTYSFLGLNLSLLNSRKLLAGLTYWPVFAVYFIASGIYQIKFCSFDTEKKGRNIWNGIVFHTLGMLLLEVINLSGFLFIDRALFHWGRFAFGPINYMILILPFVGIINSRCYKKTGKIYLGAFINAFIFTWLFLSCNAFYYS